MIVTRFAPSPTGQLHLGNVRTALLNWAFARSQQGRFLLRFEDTDAGRSTQDFIASIKDDLVWLGLDWDGEPRLQSAHAAEHRQALETLAARQHAYRCFCSESQLALDRKLAASRGLPPRYAGRCRQLPPAEAERRAAAGEAHVWRLAAHAGKGGVAVHDRIRGDITFERRDMDDPVLVRSDGSFTFLLPNALDDALDGVTHVLRGDDHLSNTAYQVWLLSCLGRDAPVYLHHGLLLGADGAKLSKRTGSTSVAELRQAGLLPGALVQAMIRIGHPNLPEQAEGLSDLLPHLQMDHLSASAVRWSDDELWRWHARMLHGLGHRQLADLLRPLFPDVPADRLDGFAALVQPNLQRVEDARDFARLLAGEASLSGEAEQAVGDAGSEFFDQALAAWTDLSQPDWPAWIEALKQRSDRKGKALFMPLRAALTGATHGPEMSGIVAFLGHEGVIARLKDARVHRP
jgi:glutamyl-tRNA synthetase